MPSWSQLESTFREHPKFVRLAGRLGIGVVLARGHVATLWAWATDYAPDGDLRDFEVAEIGSAAQWPGDPHSYVDAMVFAKLLDKGPHGYVIHEFLERAKSYKAAIQKAEWRAQVKSSETSPRTVSPRARADRTDRTDLTRPDTPARADERVANRAGKRRRDGEPVWATEDLEKEPT